MFRVIFLVFRVLGLYGFRILGRRAFWVCFGCFVFRVCLGCLVFRVGLRV